MLTILGSALVLIMTPQGEAAAKASQPMSADDVVCKRITVRGSNIKKRICATAEDWERQARASRELTREFQRSDGSAKAGT